MNKYYEKFEQAARHLDKVNPDEVYIGLYLGLSVIHETYPDVIDWNKMDLKVSKAINKAYEDGIIYE